MDWAIFSESVFNSLHLDTLPGKIKYIIIVGCFQIWSLGNKEYRYSYMSCVDICVQNLVRDECQCYPASYPSYTQPNNWDEVPFCLSLKLDGGIFLNKSLCMTDVISINLDKCYKSCHPPCEEFRHSYNTYDTLWPSKMEQLDFYKQIIKGKPFEKQFSIYPEISKLVSNGNMTEAKRLLKQTDLIEDNFAKISVYLTTTNIVVIEDKPSTTLTDLFGGLGGTLNLYSGISFIILIELIDLLYNILFTNTETKVKKMDREHEECAN